MQLVPVCRGLDTLAPLAQRMPIRQRRKMRKTCISMGNKWVHLITKNSQRPTF